MITSSCERGDLGVGVNELKSQNAVADCLLCLLGFLPVGLLGAFEPL